MTRHHFTVDVEEYFQVSAFDRIVDRNSWHSFDSRLSIGMGRILDLLDRHRVRGTFFTLGWVARKHPSAVREIVDRGHELASHGENHRRVTTINADQFRESVRTSKAVLEDVAGVVVLGYRAPSFSIVPGREWALDVLIEEGYRYDSSLFPIRRPGYGYPQGKRDPHWLYRPAGRLAEFPPTTKLAFGMRLPAAGGGYLRQFPLSFIRSAFAEAQNRGQPGTFFVHPWELDPDQPRLNVPALTRVRHYRGLATMENRIDALLSEFLFGQIHDSFRDMDAAA